MKWLYVVFALFLISCAPESDSPLVDQARLIDPNVGDLSKDYPGFSFRATATLETRGEKVLVTDPTYLADIFGDEGEESAKFVRQNGVILADFGGDKEGPIWWRPPYLVMPLSAHYPEDLKPPTGVKELAKSVWCDAASFVFLPITDSIPAKLKGEIEAVIKDGNGVLLDLPAGKYQFHYEQFDAPEKSMTGIYRNIVARHQ